MINNIVLRLILTIGDILAVYQFVQLVFEIALSLTSVFSTKKTLDKKLSGKLLGF